MEVGVRRYRLRDSVPGIVGSELQVASGREAADNSAYGSTAARSHSLLRAGPAYRESSRRPQGVQGDDDCGSGVRIPFARRGHRSEAASRIPNAIVVSPLYRTLYEKGSDNLSGSFYFVFRNMVVSTVLFGY